MPNDNTDIIQTLSEDPLVPYGITKWPFIAQHKEELSFRDGETVFLHRYIDGDWCEGEIEGKIGIFPISYVDIMVDLEGAQSTFSLQNGYEPQSLDEQSITSKKMIRSGQLGSSCCESFLVLYDFIGSEPNDLRCKAGDTVTIMKHINDEWIEGKNLVTHESGIMPICFLDVPNSELTSASMTEVKLRPHSNGETAPNRMSINSTLSSMSSTQAGGQSQQSTQRQERTELRPISITSGFKPPRPQPPVLQAEEQQFKSKTLEELENERATKILERRDLRLKVATELTQSEKDYIRDLQVILEVFKPISTEIPQV